MDVVLVGVLVGVLVDVLAGVLGVVLEFSPGLGVSFRWNRLQIEVIFLRKYKARVAGTVYVGGSVQFRPRGELPLESASDRGNLF